MFIATVIRCLVTKRFYYLLLYAELIRGEGEKNLLQTLFYKLYKVPLISTIHKRVICLRESRAE